MLIGMVPCFPIQWTVKTFVIVLRGNEDIGDDAEVVDSGMGIGNYDLHWVDHGCHIKYCLFELTLPDCPRIILLPIVGLYGIKYPFIFDIGIVLVGGYPINHIGIWLGTLGGPHVCLTTKQMNKRGFVDSDF
jgi:hypothetical protein